MVSIDTWLWNASCPVDTGNRTICHLLDPASEPCLDARIQESVESMVRSIFRPAEFMTSLRIGRTRSMDTTSRHIRSAKPKTRTQRLRGGYTSIDLSGGFARGPADCSRGLESALLWLPPVVSCAESQSVFLSAAITPNVPRFRLALAW